MEISIEIVAAGFSLFGMIVLGFWGWLAIKVIQLHGKYTELEQRILNQDTTCTERLDWLRNMDSKLNHTSEGVSQLVGHLLPVDQQNQVKQKQQEAKNND